MSLTCAVDMPQTHAINALNTLVTCCPIIALKYASQMHTIDAIAALTHPLNTLTCTHIKHLVYRM